ncbi:cation exchanger 3 [Artemisia annua]|uniref:Cation exchanger 3 n=1 Tax=Artemisia annua TaxID=35608 RepID=A0A2U1QFD9_ARTAN|nr:cation exchanger 3 [Artemisia annua]
MGLGQNKDENDDVNDDETPVNGLWSGIIWLIGMTTIISLFSEFLVDTIEEVSTSWGISVSFISIIELPIVGNAAEHVGAIIFAFKHKLVPHLTKATAEGAQIGRKVYWIRNKDLIKVLKVELAGMIHIHSLKSHDWTISWY